MNLFITFLLKNIFFTGSYSNQIFPPPLSNKEEKFYLEELNKGNQEARNKLIEHNLRLVAHIVKKFDNLENYTDDLISIGTIGLIKAIDSFKNNKQIRITTYAARCIENEILMHFRSTKKYTNDISLNESIGIDKDGNEISLLDVTPSKDTSIEEQLHNKDNKQLLTKYINILNNREKEIIIKRYGLLNTKEQTQKEIAKELKISRSYVSRIEKKALTKLLRKFIKDKKEL